MEKIKVNKDSCIGCGACVAIDPEHFDFGSEGKSEVISQENIQNNNNLTNAIESCPVAAISIGENEDDCSTSSQEENCNCDDCHCSNCSNHIE